VFLWRIHEFSGLGTFFLTPQPTYHALTLRTIETSHLFLYYFGVAGAIIFGYAVLLLGRRPRAIDVALLALFVVAMAIAMERTHFLWVLCSWVFLRLAPTRSPRTVLQVVVTILLAMAIALPYYLAVGKWLGKTPSQYSNYIRIVADKSMRARSRPLRPGQARKGPAPTFTAPVVPASRSALIAPGGPFHRFSVLYMSVGAPLPTFNYVVVTGEPLRYGQMTLRPSFRLAERLRLIPGAETLSIYPDVPTPYPANAYTYLYEFFLDFGWLGVVVLPALLGWISGVAHARTSEAVSLSVWPLLLSQLQGMILWTPFANRFVTTVNVYMVVLLAASVAIMTWQAKRTAARAAPIDGNECG